MSSDSRLLTAGPQSEAPSGCSGLSLNELSSGDPFPRLAGPGLVTIGQGSRTGLWGKGSRE